MTSSARSILIAAAALMTVGAGTLAAQSETTKSTYWVRTFGLSSVNTQMAMSGNVRRADMRRSTATSYPRRYELEADGWFVTHCRVFGFKFTAGRLNVDAAMVEGYGSNPASAYVAGASRNNRVYAHARLRIGLTTIYEDHAYSSFQFGSIGRTLNVIDVSKTFYPGGVPVTVGITGGATISGSVGATLTLSPARSSRWASGSSVGLAGTANGYLRGAAFAMLGWSGFGAGVEVELRFADTTLDLGISANHFGVSGNFDLVFQPLRFFLNVFAECGTRWTQNVWNWSMGRVSRYTRTFS